jgi:hypothetical protein
MCPICPVNYCLSKYSIFPLARKTAFGQCRRKGQFQNGAKFEYPASGVLSAFKEVPR